MPRVFADFGLLGAGVHFGCRMKLTLHGEKTMKKIMEHANHGSYHHKESDLPNRSNIRWKTKGWRFQWLDLMTLMVDRSTARVHLQLFLAMLTGCFQFCETLAVRIWGYYVKQNGRCVEQKRSQHVFTWDLLKKLIPWSGLIHLHHLQSPR